MYIFMYTVCDNIIMHTTQDAVGHPRHAQTQRDDLLALKLHHDSELHVNKNKYSSD